MADMEVDEPQMERDEDVEDDDVEAEEVGEADDAVKWVEDEELKPSTDEKVDQAWLLKVSRKMEVLSKRFDQTKR
jgi:hypothetical protein